MMRHTSRTINPLHFEDLEPHRFEDLVRQLAYSYRSWRYLDATGRLGRDDGLDIQGVELAAATRDRTADADDEPLDDGSPPGYIERGWSIQCKRYKEIGPKLMRQIVQETVPDSNAAPYGLIVAAACDVSAETLATLREEAYARGVTEVHPWTKAHLEDMLFQPDNDHLLFAYFGLSLRARRRSADQRLHDTIVMKNRIARALKITSFKEHFDGAVLIRDNADTHYPYWRDVPGFIDLDPWPWYVVEIEQFHPDYLLVTYCVYQGWVKESGEWDLIALAHRPTHLMGHQYWWQVEDDTGERERRMRDDSLVERVPEAELTTIKAMAVLPYANIVDVDPLGDTFNPGPHLYCRFGDVGGPYRSLHFFASGRYSARSDTELDREKQIDLRADLKSVVDVP